ncbi:MAG: DUF4363 family protein [Thermoanaerobacterales bacterium]|nr:DUF4363 family protein [Thermoanaerobacterales bacterium]
MAVLLVLLVVVIGFGVWTVQALRGTADELGMRIDRVQALVKQERWQEAERALDGLGGRWEKSKKWWTAFVDHQEIDNIDFSIVRIREYLWAEDEELALGEAAALKKMIEHIPEKESFTLENIL